MGGEAGLINMDADDHVLGVKDWIETYVRDSPPNKHDADT